MVIVGLGNPGSTYSHTRHNVGFDTVEKLSALFSLKLKKRYFYPYRFCRLNKDSIIIEPLTYMNNSGLALTKFKGRKDIVVVVDQMDLPVGKIRIKRSGSSAGHNGLKSIISVIGEDFLRVYIGIGRPKKESVIDYVLSKFSEEDKDKVEKAEEDAVKAIIELLNGEKESAVIQKFNTKRG